MNASDQRRAEGPANVGVLPHEGFKETTDSIVVAFILAFVFRAFVVEAFVIPTGSMAATLYGKHGTLTCTDCGWENTYGLTDLSQRPPQYDSSAQVICQNCNHANTSLKVHDFAGGGGSTRDAEEGGAEPGDRILVFKWPLDIGGSLLGPRRWDVTVFKDPADGTTNFIKRLIGLPNEVLQIIDGDIYTAPLDRLSPQARDTLAALRHAKYAADSGNGKYRRFDLDPTLQKAKQQLLAELDKQLHIAYKTAEAQEALWSVVYDHDYPPTTLDPGQPFWRTEPAPSSWQVRPRVLRFAGENTDDEFVELAGRRITDANAYNIAGRGARQKPSPVSDLRVGFVMTPARGDGYVRVKLSKNGNAFWGHIGADGRLVIYRTDGTAPDERDVLVTGRMDAPAAGEPLEVEFRNVDHRVSLWIDGTRRLITRPDDDPPDIHYLRTHPPQPAPPPRLHAHHLDVRLSHVRVDRDEYYSAVEMQRFPINGGGPHPGWGTTGNPIMLGEGEYFMLGDNSPQSKDSRLWDSVAKNPTLAHRGEEYQLGTVPADQIIGQAFFVYWPSGHRTDLLPVVNRFGVIPNVGRMRWIR